VRDWAGFLELARKLAATEGSATERNAELRSALSRAYYSAFQDARKYVAEKDFRFAIRKNDPNPPTHAAIWNWFSDKPGRVGQLTNLGLGFRRKRNQADYEVYSTMDNLKYEVGDAIRKAEAILRLLAQAREAS